MPKRCQYVAGTGDKPDIVFFDLPGTVNSEGVISSLAGMDYIFTPISADKVVLESSLSFAAAIHKLLVRNGTGTAAHENLYPRHQTLQEGTGG